MNRSNTTFRAVAMLVFFTALNVLNFADRTLLGILAKQISEDPKLDVSYEQIGFLTGYGFILFYTLIGVGMGALADRWHRPRLMAAGLTLWSALTAATGAARSFAHIATCRAFIGVGEATLTPSALSMLGDVFPLRLRAFASGTYYSGIPLGAGIGMIVSAFLLPNYGWRGCFMILGVLGVLLVLPLLLLKDESRTSARSANQSKKTDDDARRSHEQDASALGPLLETLRTSPALVCTMVGAVFAVYGQSSSIFVMTWLQNERGMEYAYAANVGGWLYMIGGTLGSVCGGVVSDWCGRLFPSGGRLWFLAIVNVVFTPLYGLFYLGDVHAWYFKPLWMITAFGSMVWYGALFSTVTELSPPRSRATAIAVLLLAMNLLGSGSGPWITGWIGGELPQLIADHPTFGAIATPLLGMAGIDAAQSFTFALLVSVGVGFLGLPFNVIAALRYEKDAAKVTRA